MPIVLTADLADGFAGLWVSAWLPSWPIAFPGAGRPPMARRIVHRMARAEWG
ncbi:hypothetical protein [Ferrovibrio sp.]|uniref:DUF2798 domain-containing protein n=1 Tax=Ferrovibrio sp. TaxID=1917215 RepID=UPI00345C1D13